MKLLKNSGWLLTIVSCFPVIIIWIIMQDISTRFSDFGMTMISLGQLAGLVGTILFSITFILNTRLHILDYLFGGLNRAYVAHHILGTISFSMLLFHPLFIATSYALFSLKEAALFLIPGNNFAVNMGILALVSMQLFLIFTFLIKLKYAKWKITHQFLGLSLVFAAFHILFISSDISRNKILFFYIISFITAALISFIYRTILGKWLVKRYEYTITQVTALDDKITELVLNPKDISDRILHRAGQFVFIKIHDSAVPAEEHPFSIVSPSQEITLRVNIKALGDYTMLVKNIKPGARAEVEGPFGEFCADFYSENQIWIAGGVGITPFMSMIRTNPARNVDFYVAVVDQKEAIYLPELNALSQKFKNIRIFPFYSATQGRITADYIEKNSTLKEKNIFICGPPPMMKSLREQLVAKKVRNKDIITEEFGLK